MKVELRPDFEVSDESCKNCTGRTLKEWSAALDAASPATRRDAVQFLYGEMNKDAWWPTTAWVEHEKLKGIVQKDGRGEGYNICVTKSIASPIADVYEAFTGADLAKWFGDAAKFEEAGRIEDGDGNGGDMLRARKDKDLRFTWKTAGLDDHSQVDIAFADNKGKTGITLNHGRIQSRAEADGLRRAWGEALTRLKAYKEG